MESSGLLKAFFIFAALILGAAGAWLVSDPLTLLAELHPERGVDGLSPLLGRLTGMGLLLAAAISVALALRPTLLLYLSVLLYLAGFVASHGEPAFAGGAWLWLIPAVYLLPLLQFLPRPAVPIPGLGDGREGGNVKWFNPNKGFGFIVTDDGREVFVHFKALQNGGRRSLRTGTRVHFRTVETERGEQADEVYMERDS